MIKQTQWIYLLAGFALVALATLGVFLPLLPTTPLLLLAAGCFARSSEKCHRWLLAHRLFGPIIQNWQDHRCMPRRAKITAIAMMLIFGTYAIGFRIEHMTLRVIGAAFCLTGLVCVLRIPTCEKDRGNQDSSLD